MPDELRSSLVTATRRAQASVSRRHRERRRFSEAYHFEDRGASSRTLVLLLAGHKDWLWPWTLQRVAKAVPHEFDVCVVTPGRTAPQLARVCADRGWSHLTTQRGHVSVAQNIALQLHPNANRIFKVDEDIFVGRGFFEAMITGVERVKAEAEFEVGFCSPLLNVNGFSYVDFLRTLGLEEEYESRFGATRRACGGVPAHNDGNAAVWLWQHSLPVDRLIEHFAAQPFAWSIVPHRFSIGAVVFERGLWETMSGFPLRTPAPGLGDDEESLCAQCLSTSRVMTVVHDVYAGHFAFGLQTDAMRRAFEARLGDF